VLKPVGMIGIQVPGPRQDPLDLPAAANGTALCLWMWRANPAQTQHRCPTKGIPRYIRGHHPNPLRRLYAAVRAQGLLLTREVCRKLRISETQYHRLERQGSSRSHGGGASAPARDAGVRAGECGQDAGGAAAISQPGVEDSTCPHDSATSRVGCGSLTGGSLFRVSLGSHPMSPTNFGGFRFNCGSQRSVEASRSSACIRGSCASRLGRCSRWWLSQRSRSRAPEPLIWAPRALCGGHWERAAESV